MSFLIMPFTIFVKPIFSFLPAPFQTFSGALLFVGIILLFIKRKTFSRKYNPLFFACISIFCVTQAFAMVQSQKQIPFFGLTVNFSLFLWTVLEFLLAFVLVTEIVTNKKQIRSFLRGTLLYIILMLLIGFIQFIFIETGLFKSAVHFFGSIFEARQPEHYFINQLSWYRNGSYAETMHRVNGFATEPGFFSAQFSCVAFPTLIPLLLGNTCLFGKRKVLNKTIYGLLLTLSVILLFVSKTTTGMLCSTVALLVLICFLIVHSNHLSWKIMGGSLAVILCGVGIVLWLTNKPFQDLMNQYVFEKQADNRLGATIALFLTFLHHPLIGVGYSGKVMLPYIPEWTTNNPEFINIFLPDNAVPQLSRLGKWFANYGLVIMLPVFGYLIKKNHEFSLLIKNIALENKEFLLELRRMFILFLILFLTSSVSCFDEFLPTFILYFMFFLVGKRVIEEQVGIQPIKDEEQERFSEAKKIDNHEISVEEELINERQNVINELSRIELHGRKRRNKR